MKPGNVLLAKDGRVLLTDFGIAAIEGDSSITRTGEIVGSIDYLAPERVTGGTPGTASDLWSLGATLYTAVEARSPFRRTSPISSLQAVVNDEPPALRQSGALGPVITALLRKDPAERPSAQETERMLIEAMEGREPKAAHAYVPTRAVTPEELTDAQEPDSGTGDGTGTGTATEPVPPAGPAPDQARTAALPEQAGPAPAAGSPATGRIKRAAAVALVAALVGGGAVFGVLRLTGDTEAGGGSDKNASAPDQQDGDGEDAPPAGFSEVTDPTGFTLFVPDGWKRQMNGDQIDYTPDNGKHFIRIAADPTPDYENPYAHLLDLEKQVQKRTDYKKQKLNQNTFRDSTRAALWDFAWTEKVSFPGPRRAIEQMYIAPDGTEYAIYMSSPIADWDTIRQQFDVVLSGWEPPKKG